ncbi:MAG: hypothetical protein AAF604_04855 [Acidobacteriota bacterium]
MADEQSTEKKGSSRLEEARERFQKAAESVSERYQEVSDDVRRGASRATEELRREARQGAESAKRNVRQGYERAAGQAKTLSEDLHAFVKENPGRSVAVAAAAGFLIGLLFRGRGE